MRRTKIVAVAASAASAGTLSANGQIAISAAKATGRPRPIDPEIRKRSRI
jgi:hypothetical protein